MSDFRKEITENLKDLAEILGEGFAPPAKDDTPPYQKELNADTIMNDCDALNCKFWNEGFKNNCRLHQIEVDPQHGCMQFRPKEEKGQGNGED